MSCDTCRNIIDWRLIDMLGLTEQIINILYNPWKIYKYCRKSVVKHFLITLVCFLIGCAIALRSLLRYCLIGDKFSILPLICGNALIIVTIQGFWIFGKQVKNLAVMKRAIKELEQARIDLYK